jgi:putative chitinase
VYADRLGNGSAASGDGWRFRGRGLIQITGRDNYQLFADAMGMTIETAADQAGTRQGAANSAVWFWSTHKLNVFADSWMLEKITISINGGTEDAADRVRMCNLARQAIGV